MKVAIIGGTGLSQFDGVEWIEELTPDTDFGVPSAGVLRGRVDDIELYFMPRHGGEHSIAPHKINYRANLAALKALEVSHVLAVNAVGGLDERMGPGVLVVPDQIIDYTHSRESSFFDGESGPLDHIDFTYPYDDQLRQVLVSIVADHGLQYVGEGVYGATQGPRLETAAEVRRCRRDGCDLVGMTGMPEAALARELGISYASLCLVVNWGAGMTDAPITLEEIHQVINEGMVDVKQVLLQTVRQIGAKRVVE